MDSLNPDLRNGLAAAIKAARRVAEDGARKALGGLAVGDARAHGAMAAAEQDLRRRLRAHGRQLGDRRASATGGQGLDRLVHEVAYEHWHRMLFARFLAENELLIEPQSGVAVSLADCEELAREQGRDGWTLAGRFAERMLPRIFRSGDPALEVRLAPETRQALERQVEKLPASVFTARDSLGWTYQFWQAERKDAVNRSGVKIGAEELPAVTQLFTERYMVLFLLHNTLGAWRAARILAARPELAAAASEDELRRAVRLEAHGGYDFSYLRFVREPQEGDEPDRPTGPWRPAAGRFAGWPGAAADLRVLDPCCGSGHFLIECLDLLARLRMDEERLAPRDAIDAVLRQNLFGLEIDPRCTQIAAFSLALAAWTWPGAGGFRPLPDLNVACSGLAPNAPRDEWTRLSDDAADAGGLPPKRDLLGVEDTLLSAPLRNSLGALHDLFARAPVLGSLIDPRAVEADLFQQDYESVRTLLGARLAREPGGGERTERAVAARGMAHAAELLAGRYHLVVTNVPYLARGKQGDALKRFAEDRHPAAKADLATLFIARNFGWLAEHGVQAVVTPQNWLFLTSYRKLRETLLKERTWNLVARLGPGAFETIGGHVVNVTLNVLSADRPPADWRMAGIDVSAPRGQRPIRAEEKAALLRGESIAPNDDAPRGAAPRSAQVASGGGIEAHEDSLRAVGPRSARLLSGGDPKADEDAAGGATPRVPARASGDDRESKGDAPLKAVSRSVAPAPGDDLDVHLDGLRGGGASSTIHLASQREQLGNPDGTIAFDTSPSGFVRLGVVASSAQGIKTGDDEKRKRRFWEMGSFSNRWRSLQGNADATVPYGGRDSAIDWSDDGDGLARRQGTTAWGRIGVAVGLMATKPATLYAGDLFDGNVAPVVPRDEDLLSSLWCFLESSAFAASVSRINRHLKIDAGTVTKASFDPSYWRKKAARRYPNGLPEPYADDPTQWIFHGHPCGSVVWDEAAKRTAHGPRRVDATVLQVAVVRLLGYRWPAEHDPEMRLADEMRTWVGRCGDLDALADADGIVCLPAVGGEAAGADRLRRVLAAAYEADWSADTERRLLSAAADGGRPADSLETWLRDHFFEAHCRLFHQRPFVWHVWDGRRDGFHALVNYHRLAGPAGASRRTLEALTWRHLGDWIARQRRARDEGADGADGRLAAAQDLQHQLERILAGEPPCDLFVRWKPLAEQPIGWSPDINDGVRLNIRPFVRAELARGSRAGAGLLRAKPGITWRKDRGKEALRPRTGRRPTGSAAGAPEAGADDQPKLRPRDEYPWFWNCPGAGTLSERTDFPGGPDFDGNRWNDLHYTNAAKRAARARQEKPEDVNP